MAEVETPLVSVIMGAYNAEATVERAIESILKQDYKNLELIVCDDASTDETYECLERAARKDPGRVKVLRNAHNLKLAATLNECLAHSSGDFIARMDADDISLPQRIGVQVDYLLANEKVDLVGTAMRRFDDRGKADVVRLPPSPDRYTQHRQVPFAHATILVRRRVFEELGGYTVAKRTERGQDADLWYRFFAASFNGVNLPEALYLVREDKAAVRRRTLSVRFMGYRTHISGYRLLGYPIHWYIRPTLRLLKGFAPYPVARLYRKWQKFIFQMRRTRVSVDG